MSFTERIRLIKLLYLHIYKFTYSILPLNCIPYFSSLFIAKDMNFRVKFQLQQIIRQLCIGLGDINIELIL